MVAINGRSILDTLNVDKAFMGANSLSLKQAPAWPISCWQKRNAAWLNTPAR